MSKYHSHIWHPFTKFSALENDGLPIIERGEGIYLFDQKANKYIDGISSWWCVNLGHSNPDITRAINAQTKQLQQSILGNLAHSGAIQLAEEICRSMANSNRHVLYASDGSSANESALKVAIQYFDNIGQSQRNKFVSLTEPYHGDTIGAVSVGYIESFHKPLKPLLFETLQLTPPATSDPQDYSSVSTLFQKHGSEIAAVIVEPLCQGASGMRMYSPDYLKLLAQKCKEAGCLLIVDEIAMGMGRTGKMWAHEHAGIDPDIVTIGKGITAGYLPLSAAIFKDQIYQTFNDHEEDKTFYHGHTFAGNPLACSAALATLKYYREHDISEQARIKGTAIHQELSTLETLGCVKEVRSLGMVNAIELQNPSQAQQVKKDLLHKGILLRPLGAVIYLMLPLVVDDKELKHIVQELKLTVQEL